MVPGTGAAGIYNMVLAARTHALPFINHGAERRVLDHDGALPDPQIHTWLSSTDVQKQVHCLTH